MTPGPGLQRTLLPLKFSASGINCGVRKYRPDIGIIMSDVDAVAAGVFTLNQMRAAAVVYSQKLVPSSCVRAIVTNSGQANAATGAEGVQSNLQLVQAAADYLQVRPEQVLIASTGVIGVPLAIDKLLPAIPELVDRATDVAENFALAILTTDLVPKSVTHVLQLSGGSVRMTGISKGSGMIHPNMATMLGYLLTDLKLDENLCQSLLREAVEQSFNMISVDGDSSTNDCVFMLANGASGVELKTDQDFYLFKNALIEMSQFLAKSIAADGEGATKLIEVDVVGCNDLDLARRAARCVTLSPLVKTAMHGEDPNWGRILAKLGAEQVPFALLEKMTLRLQDTVLFSAGKPVAFDRVEARKSLKQSKILVHIDFDSGPHQATAWGCDLSKKYVDINTEYS